METVQILTVPILKRLLNNIVDQVDRELQFVAFVKSWIYDIIMGKRKHKFQRPYVKRFERKDKP